MGKTFPRSALAAVTSTPEAEVERVLTALVRKEILFPSRRTRAPPSADSTASSRICSARSRTRRCRGERKARHLAVAAQLESEWAEGEPETAEIVAFHFLTALQLDSTAADAAEIGKKARVTLVRAGERAASLAGTRRTALLRAGGPAPIPRSSAELHERAGEVAMQGRRTVAARTHFEQAIATFEEIGHAPRGPGHGPARDSLAPRGDIVRAISDLERALSVLADEERDADVAMLEVQLGRTLFFIGRVDEALAWTGRLSRSRRRSGSRGDLARGTTRRP